MKIVVLGPAHPFRGGIAHHTTLLARHLRASRDPRDGAFNPVHLLTFARQYPDRLYPGRSDRDPSAEAVVEPAERILAPLDPLSWWRCARRIAELEPDLLVIQWWVPFWAPSITCTLGLLRARQALRSSGGPAAARILFICHNVLPHEGARIWTRWLVRAALWAGDAYLVHSASDEAALRALLGERFQASGEGASGSRAGEAPALGEASMIRAAPKLGEAPALGAGSRPGSSLRLPRLRDRRRASLHRGLLPMHGIAEAVDRDGARAALGLPTDARVMLFFGFVRPYKGLETLVDALPACVERLPDPRLVVAGEFWTPVAHFEARAAALGIADRIRFDDRYVPNEEVGRYFSAADLLVMPYRSATQSGVVTLAVRFGLPIVATRVGGLPEVVLDGETGLIVPPGDPEALAEAICAVLGDEDLRRRLSEGVLANAERFGWAPLVDLVLAVGASEAR